MDQRIIDLYDSFTHGGINRREFLDRLAEIAGSSAAALALLPLLQNDYARAAIVAPDDARLAIDTVSYDAAAARASAAIWRGSNRRASARRSSSSTKTAGSIRTSRTSRAASRSKASSPSRVDMLSPLGGTPADEDKARDMIGTLDADETARRIAARCRSWSTTRNRPARSARSASAGAAAWSTASRCWRPI